MVSASPLSLIHIEDPLFHNQMTSDHHLQICNFPICRRVTKLINVPPPQHLSPFPKPLCMYARTRAQPCSTLCEPSDCSPSGSTVHGISQARILKWVALSFSSSTRF